MQKKFNDFNERFCVEVPRSSKATQERYAKVVGSAAAEDDATAPYQNSLQYFMHLSTNAGVKMNRVGVYPNGGHGFNICFDDEGKYEVCNWPLKAKVWLEDLEYL